MRASSGQRFRVPRAGARRPDSVGPSIRARASDSPTPLSPAVAPRWRALREREPANTDLRETIDEAVPRESAPRRSPPLDVFDDSLPPWTHRATARAHGTSCVRRRRSGSVNESSDPLSRHSYRSVSMPSRTGNRGRLSDSRNSSSMTHIDTVARRYLARVGSRAPRCQERSP